ncbi:leucine-rich repeat domain-containing protein [Gaetbulibacter jejuensis]|uniref:leucine-rich repeat domain-containing protein n=1 Tax=Gaetbulibacter jejuensis TaxID=584607 RepID=UPI0030081F27
MKKQLLLLMALALTTLVYSQTFTAFDNNNNTLEFNITSTTTVEVKDYISGGTDVDIPATVSYNSTTYNVTGIGVLAFQNNTITSVDIPNSVTTIGVGAFSGSTLNTVSIGNGVVTVGASAFYNCSITDVTIPASVTSIGNYAFQNNSLVNLSIGNSVATIGNWAFTSNQLASLTIPDSVTSIGEFAFQGNPLTCIISEATVPPTITTSTTSGMDTFNTDRSNINLSIPSGTLSDYAAATWTGFNSVAEGVTENFTVNHITYAITSSTNNTVKTTDYNTTGGAVVNIPATVTRGCETYTVTEIGNNSFLQNQLTSVTIPDTVISIGEGAFNNNSISSLTLGSNVEIIGNWAFRHNSLTSLTIPNSVTSISIYAFGNNNITNLSLGSSIEIIGDSAFSENDILSLTIPDSVISIGDNAFIYSDNMTSLVIGNNVTNIGDFAFAMNPSLSILTNVIIPASVTTIGEYAFGISSLTDVTVLATTPPTITTGGTYDTFATYRSNIHLHIPPGTMGAYVTDAGALWTGFNPVTEDALSVDEFQLQHAVKIITNPESLTITSTNNLQLNSYTLYTITGAKIHTGASTEISTSTMSKGIYVLKLDFNQGSLVKKVMIN